MDRFENVEKHLRFTTVNVVPQERSETLSLFATPPELLRTVGSTYHKLTLVTFVAQNLSHATPSRSD